MKKTIAKSFQGKKARTSAVESMVSWLVVGLLVVVAATVYRAQQDFNPAVLALQQVGNAVESASPAKVEKADSFFAFPPGFSELSPPEEFDENTLSDKINGKAELYLPAGFQTLRTQRLKNEGDADIWYEFFAYDMGSVLNAFSVYSAQRRDDAQAESFARFAYGSENALFWVHGPFYAEIVASDTTSDTRTHLLALAKAFNEQHPVSEQSIDETDLFPQPGLVPESIAYIPANAFGFEGLDRIFTARYRLSDDGDEIVAFLSRRESADDARAKADAYVEFMTTFGGEDVSGKLATPGAKMVDFLDAFDAVATEGPFLAGVHEAPDAESASNLLKTLTDGLRLPNAKK